MADTADFAQEQEERFRAEALAAARLRPPAPAALERPAARTCLDCGADIPAARLIAVPTAHHCCPCQARLDRRRL